MAPVTRTIVALLVLSAVAPACDALDSGADEDLGETVLLAGRTPPGDPDGDPQAEECLNSEGANSAAGRVHNRFLWCQRWFVSGGIGIIGPGGTTNASTFELEYTAVGYGRDDGQRDVRIFFRGDDLDVRPLKGSIRPQSLFSQQVVCDFGSCIADPLPIVKPFTQWLHQWTAFTVTSDATGFEAPDRVLRHQWHFRGSAQSVLDPTVRTPDGLSDNHTIRCDSAPYFRGRSAACIFDDVIPHLQYSAAPDSRVRGVAEHIRCAQNSLTCLTYPEANVKLIPGTFVPGQRGPGLHRIPGADTAPPGNQRAAQNRAEARRACDRVGRYRRDTGEFPGLPPELLDPATQDCDEYPFASTFEGAAVNGAGEEATGTPRFSVLGVNREQNQCGGRELARYYRDDRILYYDRDTFYVHIKNDPGNGGPDACPILTDGDEFPGDDGTGGGFPSPGQPISLDAGPDVNGREGGSILLAAHVTGALALQWTYAPGPDVSPAATCTFSSSQLSSTRITCTDDGTYTATLTATNGDQEVSDSVLVHIANEAPRMKLTSPADWQVFRAGTAVSVVAPFSDAGSNDTHTCTATWDDGTVETYPAAAGGCNRGRAFAHAGMFTIAVTVTDDDGGADTQPVMVVVYDPDAGFVTAGGHVPSPAGALAADPASSGRAHFQFNPKYHKRDEGPSPSGGKVKFRLDHADFDLDSETLEWLVVTPDGKAAVKGTGAVSGEEVGFVLYAHDIDGETDAVRFVVWPLAQGANPPAGAAYDPGGEAGYDLDVAAPLAISGGSIQIHAP